jgi:hypothetical protein
MFSSAQDLTFCYLHMTRHDLQILDTLESPDYIKGELSDDGTRTVFPLENGALLTQADR